MADLTDVQAAQTVKVVGADSAGVETNTVNASPNGDHYVRDMINTSSVSGAQSVTTSAAEAKVGASALTNRKFLSITPTGGTIYMGSSAAVTTATGTPIFKNQTVFLNFSAAVPVYLIAGSTTDTRIVEGS